MNNLHYSIDINATKQTVWETMLNKSTYVEWTGAFHPGSYYEGSWDLGSEIRFVSNDDGVISGLLGRIEQSTPYEFVSVVYEGDIANNEVNTTSEDAKSWIGSHENYRFSESDGVTTLDVELIGAHLSTDMAGMFDDMWPPALQKLKQMCER